MNEELDDGRRYSVDLQLAKIEDALTAIGRKLPLLEDEKGRLETLADLMRDLVTTTPPEPAAALSPERA